MRSRKQSGRRPEKEARISNLHLEHTRVKIIPRDSLERLCSLEATEVSSA